MPRSLRLFAPLLLTLALTGCFESKEERALGAYRDRDYETAIALARELAEDGSARGYELLALASAQGIGGERDYTAAMRWIDKAVAADPGFETARTRLRAQITADAETARKAFDKGDFDRAAKLAEPLAAYGSPAGRDLLDRLYAGHFVALPGSEMSWRQFWNECSGTVRRETEGADAAAFEDSCAGRKVVWEGFLVAKRGPTAFIQMNPGRGRVRQDLALTLAEEPDPALAEPGAKVRFSGIVEGCGDQSRPDRLAHGRIVDRARLSRLEIAREDLNRRKKVDAICVKLVEDYFEANYGPPWIEAMFPDRLKNGEEIRYRATIDTDTGADVYTQQADGSWEGQIGGRAAIHAYVLEKTYVEHFTADCRVAAGFEKMAARKDMGEILAFNAQGGETVTWGAEERFGGQAEVEVEEHKRGD
ncbi:MAG: hypothetical protein CMM50_18145 [Rhodospirillaceae bacterium]|nr:hypothetical protein [Rhodospirillaceae bacterium]